MKDVFIADNKWWNLEQKHGDWLLMLWHEERSRFSDAEAEGGLHDYCVQGLHICFSWDLHRLMTAVRTCESYPTSYWAVNNFPLKYFLSGKPMANYMKIWWFKDCLKIWIQTWMQTKKYFSIQDIRDCQEFASYPQPPPLTPQFKPQQLRALVPLPTETWI